MKPIVRPFVKCSINSRIKELGKKKVAFLLHKIVGKQIRQGNSGLRGVLLIVRCKNTVKNCGSSYKDHNETFNTLHLTDLKAAKMAE